MWFVSLWVQRVFEHSFYSCYLFNSICFARSGEHRKNILANKEHSWNSFPREIKALWLVIKSTVSVKIILSPAFQSGPFLPLQLLFSSPVIVLPLLLLSLPTWPHFLCFFLFLFFFCCSYCRLMFFHITSRGTSFTWRARWGLLTVCLHKNSGTF